MRQVFSTDIVLTITTLKMRVVVMRYYLCPLACKSWFGDIWKSCLTPLNNRYY